MDDDDRYIINSILSHFKDDMKEVLLLFIVSRLLTQLKINILKNNTMSYGCYYNLKNMKKFMKYK